MTVPQIKMYLDKKIIRTPKTDIIDLINFAVYREDVGFKFALDGFHKNPIKDKPVIGIFSLNPPGDMYRNIGENTGTVMLNSTFNWDSPVISP